MWCFFDESYPPEGGVTSVFACLMRNHTVSHVDRVIYGAQRKYLGLDHARNLHWEGKGAKLLSNYSFKMASKYGHSKNHLVVQEILANCAKYSDEHPVMVFGAAVYGTQDILKHIGDEKLSFPLVEVLRRVSAAAQQLSPDRAVNLVFDEQFTDLDAAISIRRFVSGVKLPNVSHYPLVGVSHVSPGLQLADIGAYILGRRAIGDQRFNVWLTRLRNLEWTGKWP